MAKRSVAVATLVSKCMCHLRRREDLPKHGTVRTICITYRSTRICVQATLAGDFTMDVTTTPSTGAGDGRVRLVAQVEDQYGHTYWVRQNLPDGGLDVERLEGVCGAH